MPPTLQDRMGQSRAGAPALVVLLLAAVSVGGLSGPVPRGIFPVPRTSWILPFVLFGLVYTAQVFNPHLPNILVGLIGLRVSLLYALLMPVGYWFFDSRERSVRFFIFLTLISIPVAAFGIF